MGYSYSTKCKKCGNEDTFLLGFGFKNPKNLQDLININRNKVENDFFQYIQKNMNAKLSNIVENKIFECPKCKTLHSKPFIEIVFDVNEKYIRIYHCSKCKSILVPLHDEIDASKYHCKKCGENQLTDNDNIILWD